ncbi:MAG: hypothetical protein LBF58_08100 [Deltaproteobacteria bacterium]|nr:hypothetical protein [Deltaproteobacteria bacterium]
MKIASAGYSFSLGGNASANYNTAKIYGGEITQIYGGNATGYGSPQASADGNVVTVIGGIVKGIFGGFSNADGESTANGNTVEIGGEAKIETVVYGGCVMGNGTTKAKATGNTVTISGAPTMDQAALYGGFAEDATGDIITDNTLNLKTSGLKVAGIYNFSNLNFFLPASMGQGGTVIEVRDNGKSGSGTANIHGSTVNVGVMGTASPLEVGDEVILIDADSLEGDLANDSADGKGMLGVSLLYEFDLDYDANKLKATVTKKTVNDGVKALAEGSAAGMGLLLVADGLPESAAVALDQGGIGVRGGVLPEATIWRVFSAFGGGRERIETGSHVDLSAFTASLGVARRFHTGPVDLVAGLFFEYGVGSYETYNRFPGGATVRGEGDLKFAGGGALIALDRLQAGPGYFRFELSGRAGRVENDYSSRDLRAADGTMASYRTSSPYWGLRLGAAYLFDVTDTTSAEVYARWAFTRQGGGTARLSTGEKIVFEDADSSRIKAGFRVSRRFGEKVEIYAGAAWENELQGAAKSSVFGYSIDPPTMRGHTGVAEAGLRLKPSADGPLSLDLGLEGRAGKRRGLSGHMTIKLEF